MNDEKAVRYVETEAGLAALLDVLAQATSVALDTEFVRERTYYPRLCLIQLAIDDAIWCVDPIALEDLASLFAALATPSKVKVFHAARQDLEIFFNAWGAVPAPLFDTQIAAALLGRPDQIAYAGLVQELCGIELDKSASRTDWSRRPLSERQIDYAADDVRYLGEVQRTLEQELVECGRKPWFEEECSRLSESRLYAAEPTDAWRRIKGVDKLEREDFARLVALAQWREITAKARDLPRGWILKDDRLLALARNPPRTKAALAAVDGIAQGLVRRYGEALLACFDAAPLHETEPPPPKPRFTSAGKALLQSLLEELRERSRQHSVSMSLVATRRELEMAVGRQTEIRLYEGWREEFFGADARAEIEAYPADALCV